MQHFYRFQESKIAAMYADRLQEIAPFRVMELMERAKLLESRGERVVHFEVGEPDFATAPSVIAAGQRALADGHTKYTQALGLPELRARIADYYLDKDLIEKALKPLRNGQDYYRMETVMKRWGLQLVANNRTRTILGILQSIPEETLLRHTWLAFFYGLLATDTSPRHTLPYFETCRTQFAQNNDEAGELMSLSQIIYFHFVISGRYHLGSMLLQRTQTLFERNHQDLPVEITIIVARNLAAGYCFFEGKMEQAQYYAKLGYELAKKRESGNFIAATRFILGYIALLSGDRRSATHEIEYSLYLASNPLVGMSNRLTLHIMQLCEL